MRKAITFIFTIFFIFNFCTISRAQEVNYLDINNENLEILINHAIQNSVTMDILDIQHEALDYDLKRIKNQHLELFFISGNLNEYSIQEISGNTSTANIFYPRYNIGLNMRLNHFSEIKNQKKIIGQNQKVFVKETELAERDLVAEVKKKYYEYVTAKNILGLKKKIEQFNVADFNSMEAKFGTGDVELEEYAKSRKDFYAYKLQVIEAEKKYIDTKADLEALINASLESLGLQ